MEDDVSVNEKVVVSLAVGETSISAERRRAKESERAALARGDGFAEGGVEGAAGGAVGRSAPDIFTQVTLAHDAEYFPARGLALVALKPHSRRIIRRRGALENSDLGHCPGDRDGGLAVVPPRLQPMGAI